jgi:hypothetical protein
VLRLQCEALKNKQMPPKRGRALAADGIAVDAAPREAGPSDDIVPRPNAPRVRVRDAPAASVTGPSPARRSDRCPLLRAVCDRDLCAFEARVRLDDSGEPDSPAAADDSDGEAGLEISVCEVTYRRVAPAVTLCAAVAGGHARIRVRSAADREVVLRLSMFDGAMAGLESVTLTIITTQFAGMPPAAARRFDTALQRLRERFAIQPRVAAAPAAGAAPPMLPLQAAERVVAAALPTIRALMVATSVAFATRGTRRRGFLFRNKTVEGAADGEVCGICLEPMLAVSPAPKTCALPPRLLPCGHAFDYGCIRSWCVDRGKGTCPLCRRQFMQTAPGC